MKQTPSPRETIYRIANPTVNQPVPIVVNLEIKERGRVEHLANFAYNKLRDPVLTAAITSILWLTVIFFILRRKSTGKI